MEGVWQQLSPAYIEVQKSCRQRHRQILEKKTIEIGWHVVKNKSSAQENLSYLAYLKRETELYCSCKTSFLVDRIFQGAIFHQLLSFFTYKGITTRNFQKHARCMTRLAKEIQGSTILSIDKNALLQKIKNISHTFSISIALETLEHTSYINHKTDVLPPYL